MKNKPEFKEVTEVPLSICEGRYYHTMGFIRIPIHPDHLFGGDVMWLLWRLDDEPNLWRLTYRFRWYNSDDPDDENDEKRWNCLHFASNKLDDHLDFFEDALAFGREKFFGDSPEKLTPPERITIEGDCKKWWEVMMEKKPSWMHMREATPEEQKYIPNE